jgi:hypothetical protein
MSLYHSEQAWEVTEIMSTYAIASWRDSGYQTHWEYTNRHGVEFCCKVESANSCTITPGYKVTWLINQEKVNRRQFVECWYDADIKDIFRVKKAKIIKAVKENSNV